MSTTILAPQLTDMAASKKNYRITFQNQGKVYEIYAKRVHQSGLFGFIEVEQIIFGEKSTLLVDPSEEHLKSEFAGVSRTHIPIQSVIRIDEVEKTGHSKITDASGTSGTVSPFPAFTPPRETSKS
jgi:hypothetical protein